MRRALAMALAVGWFGLAGCGTSTGDGAQPERVAFAAENSSTTVTPGTTITDPAGGGVVDPEQGASSDSLSFEISAEMLEGMLATEAGRSLIVQGLVDQTGLDSDEAECLLEALGADVLASAAGSFMGGTADEYSDEDASAIIDAAETCEVSADVLLAG